MTVKDIAPPLFRNPGPRDHEFTNYVEPRV